MNASSRYHRRHQRHHHDDIEGRDALSLVLESVDPDLLASVDKAKATVDAALARLGDPIGDALDLLSPEEFIAAVWRIPPPGRTEFLTELNVPAARKPTVVSAGLGLSRLRKWTGVKRRRASRFLTTVTAGTIDNAWDHCDGAVEQRIEAVRVVLTDKRSNPNIMRLTVLAQVRSTPGMAVGLRLALDCGLTMPAWPADAIDELRGCCHALQNLWLEVEGELADAQQEKAGTGAQPAPAVVLSSAQEPGAWDDDNGEPDEPAMTGPPHAQTTLAIGPAEKQHDGDPASPAGIDLDVATALITSLADLHAAARHAASELADRLAGGHLPDEVRLMALTTLSDAVDRASDLLTAGGYDGHPGTTVDELIAALRSAVSSAQTARNGHRDRQRLGSLTSLSGPAGSDDQILEVRRLAAHLSDAPSWNDDQSQVAAGLLALLDVIAAAAAGDTRVATEAHGRAQQQLPAPLAALTIAALLNQLAPGPASPSPRTDDDHIGGNAPAVAAARRPRSTPASAIAAARTVTSAAANTPTADAGHDKLRGDSPVASNPAQYAPHSSTGTGEINSGTPPSEPDRPAPESSSRVEDSAGGDAAAVENAMTEAGLAERELTESAELLDTADTDADLQQTAGEAASTGELLVSDLLARRQLALAAHASAAIGSRRRADALRILTLADGARNETAATAGALRAALEAEQRKSPAGDPATQVLLLAASVRACLVTADPSAGENVLSLAGLMQHLPGIDTFATTIGTAAKHGRLMYSTEVLAALAPIAGADNDLAATIEAAIVERDRRRTLDFVRATQIAELWWSRGGMIGSLLDTVINNRRSQVSDTLELLRGLAKPQDIADRLTRLDNELRSTSSRPLQGQARRKLLEQARVSLDVVRTWVDAVLANPAGQPRTPAPPTLALLRQQVKAQWPAAEHELITLGDEHQGSLTGEAVALCRDHLQRTVDMLDGIVLRGADRDPELVLHHDLLRAADLDFTADGVPERAVTVADVVAADTTDWDTAFQQRLHAEQFGTARQIIAAITDPAQAAGMRIRLEDASTQTLTELRQCHDDVAAQVARAASLGQLSDSAATSINARAEAATIVHDDDAAWQNLGIVRQHLQDILDSLPGHLHDAQEAMRNRILEEGGQSTQQMITRIEQRIDSGDLATAEEYLLAAIAGQDLPNVEASADLTAFTQMRTQMPDGITGKLVAAARNGDSFGALDFSALGPDERHTAAEGLGGWLDLRAEKIGNLTKKAIVYALRLAGIEFDMMYNVELPSGSRRSWRDLTKVLLTGSPLLPAFGSRNTRNGDRLRIMLCWGDLDVRTLFSWVTQDPGNDPVLVLQFATMSATQRAAFAHACAQRPAKPVMVLDDIALTYLALHGALQFSATERILMPYAATNPYFPQAHADVPQEMFFGRSEEIAKITDPLGPNLIYGGRQLGKSALLRAAARDFEQVRGCVAIYLPLPNGVGVSVKPDVLWELTAAKLAERGITPQRKTRHPIQNVITAIEEWTTADPSNRLLLLIDECDGFFDEDARLDFHHTTRVRNLMINTKRQFKAVFAGLHQVQRFAHLPNQPLAGAHLGDQVAVGPLSPLPAHHLLFTPMEALGIRFASDELIHRILAYCNYQPKLLQLVGEELVTSSLAERRGGPPYTFTDADLNRVLYSDTVQQRVRDTVHLTLNLDPRYKLIALVVALAAIEHGADHTITASQLRADCAQWWAQGFAGQGADEFGSLLEEMRDLGVLAVADKRWRLRSSNVLRLLGPAASIDEELCSPEWRTTVTKLSVEQVRRPVDGVYIAPLTRAQMSRLISRKVNVRVIAGTPATGVRRIQPMLEQAGAADGAQFNLVVTTAPASFGKELRAGKPGGKHRVVLSIPTNPKIDTLVTALNRETTALPPPGVTRTVVIVADVSEGGLLASLGGTGAAITEDLIMGLRRASATGMRSWLTDNERMACFGDVTMHTALMTVTGGWPILLDRAAELAQQLDRPQRICDAITASLATVEGAHDFLTATGLLAEARAQAAFEVLLEYGDPVTAEDLVGLCADAGPDPERTAAILRLLDVLVQDETDGKWHPEPITAAAWTAVAGG